MRDTFDAGDDSPLILAGRRGFAAGGAARGMDEVWVHPRRLMSQLAVVEGASDGATVTPVGVERRLRVGATRVVERVVVPWSAPHVLFEWQAEAETVLGLEWLVDLRLPPPGSTQEWLRWRQAERSLVVSAEDGATGFFAFSQTPAELEVRDAPPSDGGAVVLVRARLVLESGESVRLMGMGGAAPASPRSVRAGGRTVAAVRGREGRVRQALEAGLSAEASQEALGPSLAWARIRLGERLVEIDGGRCLVAGYGALERGDWRSEVRVRETVEAALASLATGDFEAARETLLFLGERQDGNGRVPSVCTTTGVLSFDAEEATNLYLLLAGRYLAWSGDITTLQAQWPRLMESLRYARSRISGPDPVWQAAVASLTLAAEAMGQSASTLGTSGGAPEQRFGGIGPDAREVLELVEGQLGVEPDATKGRLVMRPRPPVDWTFLRVGSLRVGDAAVSLDYRNEGGRHQFVVSQERGSAPLQLILEPELPGRLESATVDGVAAQLDPLAAGDRTRVPVQLALDHSRSVELELGG